ncbi:MAG: NAD(P)-dependent oxidoreductase [Kiloniellaceae bacterium]|nr:NAD(P)-dependent oxidoreductase [Kiloniellaceae bacterium]
MSTQSLDPVLIIGGSGMVGAQAAGMLRRFHPTLPIAIGGRNIAKAEAVAREVGGAEAVQVDTGRRGLGLPAGARYSAVAVFLKDDTLNALRFAQAEGIPHISISSGSFEVGPEMALYIHNAGRAPVLMASHWLAGAATLPTLHFARAFRSIDSIEIAAVLDEQDMGGPAAAADFERLTSAAPNPLFLQGGRWTWVMNGEATRTVTDVDGTEVTAQGYAPLDVLSLAGATDAQSIRFDLVYGESASRRQGAPFSTAIMIEIAGEKSDGTRARVRHELVHPQGQAPLTALGVTLAIERLLGLAGGAPVAPGLYLPEVLIDPAYMVQRLEEIGTEIRQVR